MINQVKQNINKFEGCGETFGDSYYPDMNPRECGKNKEGYICSDCRRIRLKIAKRDNEWAKKELEFLELNEKYYSTKNGLGNLCIGRPFMIKIKELQEIIKLTDKFLGEKDG